MSEPTLAELTGRVRKLRAEVFVGQRDPARDAGKLKELVEAEKALAAAERAAGAAQPPPSATPVRPAPQGPRLLGADTTALKVETKLHMEPLPTGIYHLLDPKAVPLLTVTVENLKHQPRRVRVSAFLEGLSAQAVKTVEFKGKGKETFDLHPTLLPDRARQVTEVQWGTLHVVVDILGNLRDDVNQDRWQFASVCESHNTFPVLCLARTSAFNSVLRPYGTVVDPTRFYGAWVTPYVDAVQERVRRAAALSPDGQIWGYQRDRESVTRQVKAIYESLQEAGLRYVNSVTDYGAAADQVTQRTRLPREALAQRSANCIDGTVLMASLLEGASLSPALVFVPGHAFVGWEVEEGANSFDYLETTMVGTADFDAARASGAVQAREYGVEFDPIARRHRLAELRADGIYPME